MAGGKTTKVAKKAKWNSTYSQRNQYYSNAGIQLVKDVAYLASLVNSEPKYLTTVMNNNFNWSGLMYDLSTIVQGGGTNNRDGNSVLPRYLNLKFRIKKAVDLPVVSTIDSVTYRLVIFRYWGSNANNPAAPIPGDVLTNINDQNAPMSFLDDDITGSKGDRQRRIEVLKSEMVTLDINNNARDYDLNFQMNGPAVQNKQHLKFLSAATQTPISGGIYLLVISNTDGAIHPNEIAINGLAKLVYYDN